MCGNKETACPTPTDSIVIAAKAEIAPAKTNLRECCIAKIMAIKKVLSPISETVINENPEIKAVSTLYINLNQLGHFIL